MYISTGDYRLYLYNVDCFILALPFQVADVVDLSRIYFNGEAVTTITQFNT